MNEKVLHLTDGTTVSAKVNFGTLYYIQKMHISELMRDEMTDDDALMIAAKMLHILLLSNGRSVSFEEALVLCPIDLDEVREIFADFQERLMAYEKKRQAEARAKQFIASV